MNTCRAPLIIPGQIYFNDDLNEYLIVTNNNRGQVYYEGVGFKGQSEDFSFIERFEPVDPVDVSAEELQALINFCPSGTYARVGCLE